MTVKQFESQPFYVGLQVEVEFAGSSRVFQVAQADFMDRVVIDKNGNRYLCEDIIRFIPPVDYNPCSNCGAIHHPKTNSFCSR